MNPSKHRVYRDCGAWSVWYNETARQRPTHTWLLAHLHHKTEGRKAKFVSGMCAWTGVCIVTDEHRHWIRMPGGAQLGSDNKSHFQRVCQLSRRQLSPGWMRGVGSAKGKQGRWYPALIGFTAPHQTITGQNTSASPPEMHENEFHRRSLQGRKS